MKKICFFLVALMVGLATHAADWYLVGSNFGWSDKAENKFTANTDGTLSLTVASLSGEIKIKEAGTWDTSFGSNGSQLKADELYTAVKNGGNIKVNGIIANATIKINPADYTIMVTGASSENQYTDLYLIGDFGSGWNESNTDRPLKLVSGTTNKYEGALTLTATTSYFKIKAGANIYGTGGEDVEVETGKSYTMKQSGNAFSMGAGNYTITVTLDKNAEEGTFVVTGSGDTPNPPEPPTPGEFPTKLYAIGNVNGYAWSTTQGVEATGNNGVYTFENVSIDASSATATDGYFSFATILGPGTATDGWADVNSGDRYGAGTENEVIVAGTPATLVLYAANVSAMGCQAFKAAAATYTITVDLNAMTVNLVKTGDTPNPPEPPTPGEFPTKLYAIGNVNGYAWSTTQGVEATGNNGVYTFENVSIDASSATATDGYFSFATILGPGTATDGWADVNSGDRYGAGTENEVIVAGTPATLVLYAANVSAMGCQAFKAAAATYTITVDLNAMTVNLVKTGDTPNPPEPPIPGEYPAKLYAIGNVNGYAWSTTQGVEAAGNNGVYKFENVSIDASSATATDGYFSFATILGPGTATDGWADVNSGDRYGAATEDEVIVAGTPATLVLYAANVSAMGCQAFKAAAATYTITVDLNAMTVNLVKTGDAPNPPEPPIPGEFPAKLYAIGNVNGYAWSTTQGVEAAGNNGVYKFENVSIDAASGTDGYFSFATILGPGTATDAWADVNSGDRYGAATEDEVIVAGTPATLVLYAANVSAMGCQAFKAAAATYTITVDLNAMTVNLVKTGDTPNPPEPPTPGEYPAKLYAIGNVNGYAWSTTQGVEAAGNNGVYNFSNVTIDAASGTDGYFSFATILGPGTATDAWADVNSGDRYGASTADEVIVAGTPATLVLYAANVSAMGCQAFMAAAGTYDIKVDLVNMTVTLSTNGDTPNPPEPPTPGEYPAKLYAIGNVNGYAWSTTQGAEAAGNNGVYNFSNVTIDAASGTDGYFSFATILGPGDATDNWADVNSGDRYGASTADEVIVAGTPATLVLYAANVSAMGCQAFMAAAGNYDIKVDLVNMTVTLKDLSGIEAIEAAQGNAVYYNMQGVKVENPANGLYIVVRNGKVTKEIVK